MHLHFLYYNGICRKLQQLFFVRRGVNPPDFSENAAGKKSRSSAFPVSVRKMRASPLRTASAESVSSQALTRKIRFDKRTVYGVCVLCIGVVAGNKHADALRRFTRFSEREQESHRLCRPEFLLHFCPYSAQIPARSREWQYRA